MDADLWYEISQYLDRINKHKLKYVCQITNKKSDFSINLNKNISDHELNTLRLNERYTDIDLFVVTKYQMMDYYF